MVLDRILTSIINEIVQEVKEETGKELTFNSVLMAVTFQSRAAKFAIDNGFDFVFPYLGKLRKKKRAAKTMTVSTKVIRAKKGTKSVRRITLANGMTIRK